VLRSALTGARPATAPPPTDRLADARIGAAAAQVRQGGEVALARLGLTGQQVDRSHDLAGLAIAALGNVFVDPGLLHRMQPAAPREPLDGGDAAPRHL